MIKKRNPYIAFLLGLIPPLGQAYNGQLKKGLILFVSYQIALFTMVAIKVLHTVQGLIIFNLFYILFWLYMIADAVIESRKQKIYHLKNYNRWFYYVGIWLIICAFYLFACEFIAFRLINNTRAFYIPTHSMMPTIMQGDHVLADLSYYRNNSPGRGHIVLYLSPAGNNGKTHIHRCVAIEGDFFEIKEGSVFINGKRSEERYAHGITDTSMIRQPKNLTGIVPAGHVVILGDNRQNCMDSRFYGYLPVDKLIGRALYVYYSKDKGFTAKYLNR